MAKKAFYPIGGKEFSTKEKIEDRCREIIKNVPNGEYVAEEDIPFLMDLFRYHDEWEQKSSKGIKNIIVEPSGEFLTRAFVLILSDGSKMDISFKSIVRLLRGDRTRELLPRALIDYKNAARSTITDQIRSFRDQQLALNIICPISGEPIIRSNCEVDHEPPDTFDKLLFDFTVSENIEPLKIKVGSKEGTIPYFEDEKISRNWIDYHSANARLRLLSTIGHAQISSPRIDWNTLVNR
jgi:hypothetical protein